jgi:hypothetical protein
MFDFILPQAPESIIAKATSSALGRLLDAIFYVPLVSSLMYHMDKPYYKPSAYLPLPYESTIKTNIVDEDDGNVEDARHPLNR